LILHKEGLPMDIENKINEIKISILTGIPGSGKTRTITERAIQTDGKYIILSSNHKQLEEIENYLLAAGISHIHWRGMKKICPSNNNFVQKLKELKAPVRFICSICDRRDNCVYREQFTKARNCKIILSPIQYLATKYIEEINPEHIIIDDTTNKARTLKDWDKILDYLADLKKEGIISEEDPKIFFANLGRFYSKITREIQDYIDSFHKTHLYSDKGLALELISNIFRIDPLELLGWGRAIKIRGWEITEREKPPIIPFLFYAFDLIQREDIKSDLTIVDASFEQEHWESRIIQRYEAERDNLKINLQIEELKINLPKNTVYQIISPKYQKTLFTIRTLDSEDYQKNFVQPRIRRAIEHLSDYPHNKIKIGLVSWKNFIYDEDKNTYHPEIFIPPDICMEVDCLHFGALRSRNLLEDSDIHIVIGTYLSNFDAIFEDYESWTLKKPKDILHKDSERGWRTNDRGLDLFTEDECITPMYHAIHRGRQSIRVVPTIVYGRVPDKIKEEFKVKYLMILDSGEVIEYENMPEEYILNRVREVKLIKKADLYEELISIYSNWSKDRGLWYRRIDDVVKENKDIDMEEFSEGVGRPNQYLAWYPWRL
jgi:hypothetical protein